MPVVETLPPLIADAPATLMLLNGVAPIAPLKVTEPLPVWTNDPAPLDAPVNAANAVLAVFVTVKVLLAANVPAFVKLIDLEPLIVGVPEILVPLFPKLAVPLPKIDCTLPPFKLNAPVPKAFVVLFAAKVPLANVTLPVKFVFAPLNTTTPVVALTTNAPELDAPNALLKVVVPVFVTVNVLPDTKVTLFVNVMLFAPLIVGVALLTLVLLFPTVAVPPSIDCNTPPLKLNTPVPKAFVALFIWTIPPLNVVALL